MRVEQAEGFYIVHDGEYSQYFDTIDDARAYVSLIGIFSAQYDRMKKPRKKLFTQKRFAQPMNFFEGVRL